MKRKVLFVTLTLVFITQQIAAQKKIPPEKPKLIIGIVVEQMRYDYIEKYWNKFSEKGFKKLVNEGAFCENARYNYMFNQPGTGHATIATGTNPSKHGIISTQWWDRSIAEMVYCVQDYDKKTIGNTTKSGQRSPKHLLSTTVSDALRQSNFLRSKVIGVSLRDCASILLTGHSANAAYWFDDRSGNWVSSSFYMDELPKWVNDFNDKRFPDLYLERTWSTLLPLTEYTESFTDNSPYENGFLNEYKTFPYNLPELNKLTREYTFFKNTPFANSVTKDFAIAALLNEDMGKDEYTDMLMIDFAAGDFTGRQFGPGAVELEDIYLRLDQDIAHLLKIVNNNIGKENVVIFLTSDHGSSYTPSWLKQANMPTGYFNYKTAFSLLRVYLNAIFGKGKWIEKYHQQQFYLNQELIEDSKIDITKIEYESMKLLEQFSGVSRVMMASKLQREAYLNGDFEKIQNSFQRTRSGNLIISLLPGWMEEGEEVISYNSFYNYDTHVPLVWYGWKIKRNKIYQNINMVDIAPTLSQILKVSLPNASKGRPIQDIFQ